MQILLNELMKNHTTLGIGGKVKEFITIENSQELIEAIKDANKNNLSFMVIGSGSNLLVSDDEFEGIIIKNDIKRVLEEDEQIKVSTGTLLQTLVDYTIENGLFGMQNMVGIPGTVGGALYGNAAAYGQTVSDHLVKVLIIDGEKEIWLTKDECEFDYRDSGFKKTKHIILEAVFSFPKANHEDLKKESEETLAKRLIKYPPGIKTPGSFFKNVFLKDIPEDKKHLVPDNRDYYGKVPAWFFLNEVGARGDQLGQIKIADTHGNTFINLGDGKASDFYKLAKKYYQKVKERFNIELEPEVQFINLPPLNS